MTHPVFSTLDELIELLDSRIQEKSRDHDDSTDTDRYSAAPENLPSSEAIDHIIESTLNSFLESGTFPTLEQANTLRILQDLKEAL